MSAIGQKPIALYPLGAKAAWARIIFPCLLRPSSSIRTGRSTRSTGMISHSFFRESRLTLDFEAMKLVTESC